MFLTLGTYRAIKVLDLNGTLRILRVMNDSERKSKFKDNHSGLVYDKEWPKLIANIELLFLNC